MLATEIQFLKRRHQQGQKIFRSLGMVTPAFGMIGTLIGLVQMLQKLSEPNAVGPAMAIALLTTLYGAVLANLVFLPLATKLEQRSAEEVLLLQLIAVGIRSVTSGDYPRLTQTRLEAFLAPVHRQPDPYATAPAAPVAAPEPIPFPGRPAPPAAAGGGGAGAAAEGAGDAAQAA
jgi:chemotaxis protein MotA